MNPALSLIALLFIKHFIVDFPLQTKYQYLNKGTYLHPGGLLHAVLHGVGTFICVYWYAPLAALFLAWIDIIVHYPVDWAKVNINQKFQWGPTTHEQFWWLMGFDQLLHALTYVVLVAMVVL